MARSNEKRNVIYGAKKVWQKVKKSAILKGQNIFGNKWVFKCKDNGMYHVHQIALRYYQVPKVDHQDKFSMIVVDITYRIVMILALVWKYNCEIVDVETDFLYGALNEMIYIKLP